MDKNVLSKTKLFEKIEISWFSIDDMKKRKGEFRNFYQEMVDKFIEDSENIYRFIESKIPRKQLKTNKHNKTQRK